MIQSGNVLHRMLLRVAPLRRATCRIFGMDLRLGLKAPLLRGVLALFAILLIVPALAAAAPGASAYNYPASPNPKLDRLIGVYQIVPFEETIPPNFKAMGTLDDLPLSAKAEEQSKSVNLRWDPATNCRVVGPFRMMAMPENRIEFLPTLTGGLFMLFQNASLGNRRQIEFKEKHSEAARPSFEGDSIAHWKGDDLVVDTTGFNDATWLNGHGAPHDAHLHMVETFHFLPEGEYLELTVRIEDPSILTRPYTYTRFYRKQTTGLGDYFCQEDDWQN